MKIQKIVSLLAIGILAFSNKVFSLPLTEGEESSSTISCHIPGDDMNQQSYHKVSISEIVDDPDYANVSVRKWLQQNYSVPPIVLPIGDPVESKLKIKLGELNEDKSIVHYGEDSDLIQLSISFKIDDESEIRLTMARVGEDTFEGEFHCSYEE